MVQVNFAKREVQCKVVYYGPAEAGKTANLRAIHDRVPETVRGALTTIATDTDRTLFFDFLPLDLGLVAGIRAKIHLYAIPYIENQNAMRLLVLQGVDGVIFVADARRDRLEANREAWENLRANLKTLAREIDDVPVAIQWNKTDAPDAMSAEELNDALNPGGRPAFPAAAESGAGVFATLKSMTQSVLQDVSRLMAHHADAVNASATPLPEPAPEPEPQPEPQASESATDTEFSKEAPDVGPDRETIYVPPWRKGQHASESQIGRTPPEFLDVPLPESEDDAGVEEEAPETPAAAGSFDETETSLTATGFGAPEVAAAAAAAHAPKRGDEPSWSRPGPADDPAKSAPGAGGAPNTGRPLRTVGGKRATRGPATQSGRFGRVTRWDGPVADDPLAGLPRGARPAVDRRRTPRHSRTIEPVPASRFATGAVAALFCLIAIGYMVHELL